MGLGVGGAALWQNLWTSSGRVAQDMLSAMSDELPAEYHRLARPLVSLYSMPHALCPMTAKRSDLMTPKAY